MSSKEYHNGGVKKRPPRKKQRRPPRNKRKTIAGAASLQLILLRDVIGIGVTGSARQLIERRKGRRLTDDEISAIELVRADIANTLGHPAPAPVTQPDDVYARHWATVCNTLGIDADPAVTQASPRLVRMLAVEVLTKHDRPLGPALTQATLYILAREVVKIHANDMQTIRAGERKEIVGGLVQRLIDRGMSKAAAQRQARRIFGAESARTMWRRFKALSER